MKELDEISFAVEFFEKVSKIKEDLLFKIVAQNHKFYIAEFSDKIVTEILPKNLNDDAREFLENLPINYASIIMHDRRNHTSIISCRRIFGIKSGIEKMHIYYEGMIPDSLVISKAIDKDSNAILVYSHIYNKAKDAFMIESSNHNKAYPVMKKVEYNKDNNYAERTLLSLVEKDKKIKDEKFQTFLLVGNIAFSNTKEYVSENDLMTLYAVQADVQNYLNLWREYNRIELEREFTNFKKASYVRYDSASYNDEIKLYFNDENFNKIVKNFKSKMCFLGSNSLLTLFQGKDLDSYNKIEKSLLDNKKIIVVEIKDSSINPVEKSVKIRTEDRKFFQNDSILRTGFICLSLLGNKISYQRREKAKERIITGKAGIQKMYTWFTENPEPQKRTNEVISIDGSLLTKNNLTPNQREAIEIICNTPDICIIQGPPGTGKTTTIREALIQINSLFENKYNFGNNLLSGFRHETVLNLTESIDLFGLPAVKVGDSSKNSNSDELEPRIIKFIDELIDSLKVKYQGLTASDDEYIEFKKRYFNYVSFNNSIDSSIEILDGIKNLEIFKFDSDINNKVDSMITELKKQGVKPSAEQSLFLDFLYALPMDEASFKDDKDRIMMDIEIFKSYQSLKKSAHKLEKAYILTPFSKELITSVRRDLILEYKEKPIILTSKGKKQEIIDYLNQLLDIIKCARLKRFDGDKIAILDYIDSLTENPLLIRDTLLEYTKVLGATNQQSISKNMYTLKNDDVLFDNVFIDEAATSSPLDLFIPMSLAKKKIILVGDHKQLPNITDEGIIDEVKDFINKSSVAKMNEEDVEEISSKMKQTLFEVLMAKTHELEKKDGIKRVITLNTQFRMHPELGKIVSDNFYDGIVQSIRPASDFSHNYHNMKDKYLYWIDTPYNDFYEYRTKGSSSRKNIPEAKRIAQHIKEALDDKNYENRSIGIITMYRDQVTTINDELRKIGIYDKNMDLISRYASQEIKVGTVDAFQGREFDIVYLSLVYIFNEDNNYSRLAGENSKSLMCVALSRQKRMLIVVGDMSVYNIDKAKEKVRPLYDLAMRCAGGDMHE